MNKLAIVIPYYKLTYFNDTLQCLANQTNQNFNLYIGDDCSPENPSELIDKYGNLIKKYKRFETNLGYKSLTQQWERCIDQLTEDEPWIMVLCDDDLIDNNVVEEFYKHLDNVGNINLVKYAVKIVDEESQNVLRIYKNPEIVNSIIFLIDRIKGHNHSTLSEHIFRKEKYLQHKFKNFELAYGSDDVAWIEFTEGEDIYCINDAFVKYRRSVLSISFNPDTEIKKRKMLGYIDSYLYILKKYHKSMNRDQKYVISAAIYKRARGLYYNNRKNLLLLISSLVKIIGFRDMLKILMNNKNYYNQ